MAKGLLKSRHTPKYRIKIDGVEVPGGLLCEATVDQSADMADMFMLDFFNDCCRLSDLEIVKPGAPVEIQLGYQEHGGNTDLVIKGEISVLKGNFPRKGAASLRVQGYTAFNKLALSRKTRAFKKNKSYADIAREIGGEHKLEVDVDDTPTKYEYVFQRNQTDHEFLLELASRVGYEVFVRHNEGKKPTLHFKKPKHDAGAIRILKKGSTMLSFNPRTKTALRPTAVQVLSWDPIKRFAEVYGDAKGKGQAGPAMSGEKHAVEVSASMQDAIDQISHIPLGHWNSASKDQEAKAIAEARFQRRSLEFVEAEAVCPGMPDLFPGLMVDVVEVGELFNGPYYIHRVLHDFMGSGFTTRLLLRKTSIVKPEEKVPEFKEIKTETGEVKKVKLSWWDRIKWKVQQLAKRLTGLRTPLPEIPANVPPDKIPQFLAAALGGGIAGELLAEQMLEEDPQPELKNLQVGFVDG